MDENQQETLPPGDVPMEAGQSNTGGPVPAAEQAPQTTATDTNIAAAANAAALASAPATEDPNAGVSAVVAASTADTASAQTAATDVGASPIAASSPAEPMTFEQRVEERFIALEHALMGLPHSIAHVMHQGSMEADEFAKRVLAHLFGNE